MMGQFAAHDTRRENQPIRLFLDQAGGVAEGEELPTH
jgi:hypothetical protein